MTERVLGAFTVYIGIILMLDLSSHPLADMAYDVSMALAALGLVVFGLSMAVNSGDDDD